MLNEIKETAIARYPNKIIVVKFDGRDLHGNKDLFPLLNTEPYKKYSFLNTDI